MFPAAGTNLVASFGEQRDPAMFDGCDVMLTHRLKNQRVAPVPMAASGRSEVDLGRPADAVVFEPGRAVRPG